MSKIYIIDAKRTAIGSFLGSLKNVSPSDLGAIVVKELLKDNNLSGHELDEVIIGNILSAGQGQGIGRQVAIKGGVPFEVSIFIKYVVWKWNEICYGRLLEYKEWIIRFSDLWRNRGYVTSTICESKGSKRRL